MNRDFWLVTLHDVATFCRCPVKQFKNFCKKLIAFSIHYTRSDVVLSNISCKVLFALKNCHKTSSAKGLKIRYVLIFFAKKR